MLLRAFAAALLALGSISATQSNIAPWQHPEVVKVDCAEGSGSAFSIGPHLSLSVAHVITMHDCRINDKPFTVVSHVGDFAILSVPDAAEGWLKVDCGGYVAGREYEAIGYARGLDTQTTVDLDGTGKSRWGMSRLSGVFTVIPGQSGGPIIDLQTGKVVGTVNVYNPEDGDSGSIPLASTSLCKAPVA